MSKPDDETIPIDELLMHQDSHPTAVTTALPLPTPSEPEACLVHIHPNGPTLGFRYKIGREPAVIGRGSDCAVSDPDVSVSRTHARIELLPDGQFQVIDLCSTNGTFINNLRATSEVLHDGDYLRVGNSIYRFLTGGNIESHYHEEIHRLTITDPLTGLNNRRSMMEYLERELERSTRYIRPVAVVLFDVDFFKSINDRLGHVGGDVTLRSLATRIRDLVRKDELLARYGGEEFAVVLPEGGADQALQCAERIRRAIENTPFEFEGKIFPVTVSCGVGVRIANERISITELIERADRKLYEAKHTGRNRVCI